MTGRDSIHVKQIVVTPEKMARAFRNAAENAKRRVKWVDRRGIRMGIPTCDWCLKGHFFDQGEYRLTFCSRECYDAAEKVIEDYNTPDALDRAENARLMDCVANYAERVAALEAEVQRLRGG